mmetsp:Transcript_34751/g.40229  ORF Transcript_34751/g.40229 Transcript_34751/m.40229 type:complete len:87 (+) Transcript_34751:158-418(+)
MIGASQSEIYSGKFFELLNNCNPVKCLENHRGKVCFPSYHTWKIRNEQAIYLASILLAANNVWTEKNKATKCMRLEGVQKNASLLS